MESTRRISVAAGVLFVLATVAALAAAAVVPALTGTGVAGRSGRVAVAALLYLIAAGASAGIAIALYPVLQKVNAGLAIGSVAFRTIEAVFYTVAVVDLLSIPATAAEPATAGVLISARDHATLVGVFAFCTGALMYYILFYRSRLVPRWLSGWGLAGVLLMTIAGLLSLFDNHPVTGYTPLILPIAVQEMVLAIWLLIRGFRAT